MLIGSYAILGETRASSYLIGETDTTSLDLSSYELGYWRYDGTTLLADSCSEANLIDPWLSVSLPILRERQTSYPRFAF